MDQPPQRNVFSCILLVSFGYIDEKTLVARSSRPAARARRKQQFDLYCTLSVNE